MDTKEHYEVKDITLAEQGELNLDLARREMQSLMTLKRRFEKEKPFKGLTIGLALHITKETGILVETLIAGGAEVAITGCNPLSTQDDIAAALAKKGVKVWGYKGESNEDYYKYITYVINQKPDITIDDGCDLVSEIHAKHPELIPHIIAGCEETTTGINRLKSMEKDGALKYPVIAVNDNKTKHLLDNYYGTGQSTLDGILRATNILFSGKTVVVIGYGSCGKGVAMRADGLGANVIVTEVQPFRALQAHMDGFRVMKMEDAALLGDIFISVTGNKHVMDVGHFKIMKDGAILANSGHFNTEINVEGLEKMSKEKKRVRPSLDEYTLPNGRSIYVCGEGRLVNLAAAEGHPSMVMATSFLGQSLACEFAVKNKGKMKPEVIQLPAKIDETIAQLQLDSLHIEFDTLTEEQIAYMNSWQEGT